ncbi:MarR family transcriptional regulator [Francisella halioticida]|uniref:MarR family transcriptional regulator n=1 Tax=Francisella halioticida TaxID=549298 RepID=A0ABN5B0D5_9GAMM|nr:MarR family transcriptional regulator [Francisella halioticida]ASG67150.1 MarR family transcriptional regulator [Francisella halioticida]
MSINEFTDLNQRWRRINALWYKIFIDFSKQANLTYTEAMVMHTVSCLPKGSSKSEISAYMRAEPQSITRAINSLISRELLSRSINNNDKRFAQFEFTSSGKKFSVQIQYFINQNWKRSLKGIDSDALKKFSNQLDSMIIELEKIHNK